MTLRGRFLLLVLSLLSCICGPSLAAQKLNPASPPGGHPQHVVRELQLVPEPRVVARKEGEFVITAATRIVLNPAHARADRMAAEMLADEIEAAGGRRPRIVLGSGAPLSAIYLVRRSDDRARLKALGVEASAPDNSDEFYQLAADRRRVIVAGAAGPGLFYGVQTLRQLVRREGNRLVCPAVAINDWPAMRWRGVHGDISRGPIPTLAYMKKQVRRLAAHKINLLALYMEHVFDYQSQPLIAPKEAALTAAEVKELVEYAARYQVTILPEQQAFGHLHHVLKYEIYSDLAETPHGHVLAPVNPKSYELIRSLYAEMVPLFPGPLFHIGADETFELGQGQTRARAAEAGLGRVYLEHLKRVAEIMQPYHKRLMFWGDIAVKYPELLGILPKDVIAVAWEYDPRPSFDSLLKPYHDAGLDLFVSPGANNWNRIFPDLDAAYVNIANFVRDGQKYGAVGMLNTAWNDDGETLFDMTWPAMVFGAACAWQASRQGASGEGACSPEDFKQAYDWAFYRNSQDHAFAGALNQLSRSHIILKGAGLDGAFDDDFWQDPFTEAGQKSAVAALPAAHELRLAAEHAIVTLLQAGSRAMANADTLDALLLAAWRLDLLGMKIQFAAEISRFYGDAYNHQADAARVARDLDEITAINARLEDLRDATTRVRQMYEAAWRRENRPYWLGNVLVRYDLMAQLFQQKIEQVRAARRQYRETSRLPAPESLGFYIKPSSE